MVLISAPAGTVGNAINNPALLLTNDFEPRERRKLHDDPNHIADLERRRGKRWFTSM